MFTILDKSNYLKGLLILARIDRKLIENEKNFIREIANKLGFSKDFYEDVLKSLMVNEYILDNPIQFSDLKIAELFFNDAFELAYSDKKLSNSEISWLIETAKVNGISEEQFYKFKETFENSKRLSSGETL